MTGYNYVQLHIGDFIGGCLHMDATEIGAYTMLLLAHYQAGETGIPDDDKKLSRIAKVSTKTWSRIKDTVMEKFDLENSFWKNSRVIEEFQKRSKISTDQKARALKRWDKQMPDALPDKCITNNQEPITNNQRIEIEDAPSANAPEIKIKSEKKKGTRLPPDWVLPDEWGDWAMTYCASKGLFDAKAFVIEQGVVFKNYWIAKTSQATKLDWKGTWENWIRRGLPDYQLKTKRLQRENSYEIRGKR